MSKDNWLLASLSALVDVAGSPYRGEHAEAGRNERTNVTQGLTSVQEIVEINIFDNLRASIRDAILAELSERPEHKIISLSIASYSEFATSYRALVVIEYL